MGKAKLSCNTARHAGDNWRSGRAIRCIACQRPIVYGDRCPDCQRELRQRRRRKPR